MRSIWWVLAVPLAAAVTACGGDEQPQIDEALSRDLALAASAQPYPQSYISPAELGYAPVNQPYAQPAYQGYQGYVPAPQPVIYQPAPAPRPVQRASTGTIYRAPAPAPRQEVKRNTKRDALIGATAGAIAGAAIGRDVKGAVIGAAAGGLLGAVVGHTIDVERP